MAQKDYYQILGVPRDASNADIKKAYKRLARQYHPDVAEDKTDAERKFGEINEAYAVLSDDEKRGYYDRFGTVPGAAGGMGAPDFGGGFGGGGFPFGDLFETLFDLGGAGGARGRGGPRPARGRDLRVGVRVTLEEAFTGVDRDVTYQVEETCLNCSGKGAAEADGIETCGTCHGQGQVQRVVNIGFGHLTQVGPCPDCHGQGRILKKPCPECRGRGVVNNRKTLTVKIPPGVDTGVSVRLSGRGEPGQNGGPPGNLFVTVQVEKHATFERQGDDLIRHLRVTFTEAALGATLPVAMLVGDLENLKIPAGTQSNTTFRMRGKGMPRLSGAGRGDMHVIVDVMVPTKLNAKQKKLLKDFAEAGSQEAEEHDGGILGRIRDAIFG